MTAAETPARTGDRVVVATAADGARISASVTGTGEPLVLLAGQANSHRWWDPVLPDLAGFTTIAVDTLGAGASAAPAGAEFSTRRFARDVVAVLDALGVERAHVYGTSMGGKIAQWVAAEHPDRVGALVLGCTTPGGPGSVAARPEALGALLLPDAQAREALAELMFTPGWLAAHPGPHSVYGDPRMTFAARRGHRLASAGHDASGALAAVGAPTLIVHGTADEMCPPGNATLLAERIPGAALHLVEGARHAYFVERRAEVGPVVAGFLHGHLVG